MAAEEYNDEEQEDVPALAQAPAVPAPARRDGDEADGGSAPGEAEPDRSGGRTAEEIGLDRPGQDAGGIAEAGGGLETLWKEGPVWKVRGPEPAVDAAAEAPRPAGAPETSWLAAAGHAARAGTEPPLPAAGGQTPQARAGLEGLYRQTVQAALPAAPALPPERAGRTVRAQEPGSAASLAVDELDRAVRRDSRRYDGGMSIF